MPVEGPEGGTSTVPPELAPGTAVTTTAPPTTAIAVLPRRSFFILTLSGWMASDSKTDGPDGPDDDDDDADDLIVGWFVTIVVGLL